MLDNCGVVDEQETPEVEYTDQLKVIKKMSTEEMINISLSSAEDVDLDQLPIHLKQNS